MKQYDAIIIGYGKAGKTLALELADKKWNVALIESSENTFGDSCINATCLPTKRLVYEAEIADILKPQLNDFKAQAEFYKQDRKSVV